jgi:hypothetical protein
MHEPFALHALADADLDQKIPRPLLDQARADAVFDIAGPAPTIPTWVRINVPRCDPLSSERFHL